MEWHFPCSSILVHVCVCVWGGGDTISGETTLSKTFRPPPEKVFTLQGNKLLPFRVYSTIKHWLLQGANSLHLTYFSERGWCAGKQTGSHKSVSLETKSDGKCHLVDFPHFYKRENFCDFLIAFMQTISLLKMGLILWKTILSQRWSKFYPLKVYPIPLTLALLNKLRCHAHF